MLQTRMQGARGETLYLFGLSRTTLERMRHQQQPLTIDLSAVGLPKNRVLIVAAETEEAIRLELERAGLTVSELGHGKTPRPAL